MLHRRLSPFRALRLVLSLCAILGRNTPSIRAVSLPFVELHTTDDDSRYGCLVLTDLPQNVADSFMDLYDKCKIWIVRATRIRISSHIHTRPSDIDACFGTLEEAAKRVRI